MTAKIVKLPFRLQKLSTRNCKLAYFYWLGGMDTFEIKDRLGVRSEAIVYNSLSEMRDKINKAKAQGRWHALRKPT